MFRSTAVFAIAALAACLAQPCLAAEVPAAVAAAVADGGRPATDSARDAIRKPADVLTFADVKPGARIAELFPGGGYYTRLLSVLTGKDGHVYALVPPAASGMEWATPIKAIAAGARHGNVTPLPLSYTERALGLPQPVDAVWTSDNYHDMRNELGQTGMVDFNKRVFEALKPGGVFMVIDHAAAAGRGADDGRTLHRIDPETVKAEATAAGFRFVGASDALRNADDPHTARVFDPGIRGKTDQFILKFVK
jgi:predicted methyltransferase